jgi:acetylornithine/succinyldiaminopimelate/putrescine aminotransferase
MGRTGTFLAAEGYGVQGDIVTLAKGLCGGLPAGAALARGKASSFEAGDHGSTLGGNPLVCAVGIATVRTLVDQGIMRHAIVAGAHLLERLRRLEAAVPAVATSRGRGLMAAIDFTTPIAADVVAAARQRGLIVNNTGPATIRMVPPLIITEAQLDWGIQTLREAIMSL